MNVGLVVIGSLLILKIDGPPYLCKTDEIGEICIDSPYTGSGYWGLQGLTNATFKVSVLCFVAYFAV